MSDGIVNKVKTKDGKVYDIPSGTKLYLHTISGSFNDETYSFKIISNIETVSNTSELLNILCLSALKISGDLNGDYISLIYDSVNGYFYMLSIDGVTMFNNGMEVGDMTDITDIVTEL